MNAPVGRIARPRRRLLVLIVALMSVTGVGMGLVSNGTAGGEQPVTPPGAADASTTDATLTVAVSDPPTVRNADGHVGTVTGTLTGSLTVAGAPDRVDFVVRTRRPDGAWAVVDRTRWQAGEGDLDVDALVGGTNTTYLNASQSVGFDVSTPGSFANRRGAVAVTATVYDDDDRVASVTAGDGYAFAVEHLADRTVTLAHGESPTPRPATSNVAAARSGATTADDTVDGGESSPQSNQLTSALFSVSNALPGDAAQRSHTVENPTDDTVTLRVSVGPVGDDENGRTEPEREVDATPRTGELSAALEVRLFVERADGRRQYVAGNGRRFVSLADAADATTSLDLATGEAVALVVQWQLDRTVGNEVQSDRSTVSVHLAISSA